MVNLLFISSNPKIDIIKNALQPSLKIKIDFVGDFDTGLKEVFEKRAALVFIQDQIAGVTGESVARHIQMLLGSGAPLFIYMHDGNHKAKPIKGLYEHLIDLSQDGTKLLADIQSILKLLLGPQWQKFYVSPKADATDIMPTSVVPVGHRVATDKLEEDSLKLSGPAGLETSTLESFHVVASTQDQLKEVAAAAEPKYKVKESVAAAVSDSGFSETFVTPETESSSLNLASAVSEQHIPELPKHSAAADSEESSVVRTASQNNKSSAVDPIREDISGKFQSSPPSAAEFRIERERMAEDAATEESLRAFEADYLSKKSARRWYLIAAMMLCIVVGGWYLMKQKPLLLHPVIKEPKQAAVSAPSTQTVTQMPVVQNQMSTANKTVSTVLPSFIPRAGYDREFATQKPGWERYVGTDLEFRVFRSAGKLKAVQVLSTKDHMISESMLKTVLIELAGTGEYRITSNEQKFGFQVSRATVPQKADLLIYRKQSVIHAFVVSLD
jgi:hypothetical protein